MKNKLCLLIILLNISQLLYSQSIPFIPDNTQNYYFNPQNLGLSSPQVSDFIKNENVGVDYYRGTINLDIPLDKYSDPDFDIPISLKYQSEDFVPSRRPSYVGLNWTLNVGGAITRTVHGSPDDVKGKYMNSNDGSYLKDGLWVAIKEGKFKKYTEDDLRNFKMEVLEHGKGTPFAHGDVKYDMEPDIFYFRFFNHSGQFMIDNKGNPALINGNGCKINLNKMAVQPYSTTDAPLSSTIEIITPDGYIYEFGGDVNYLEYYIPNNPKDCQKLPRSITSWLLKSVKAPNGRVVKLEYQTAMQTFKYNYYLYSEIVGRYFKRYMGAIPPGMNPDMPVNSSQKKKIAMEDKTNIPLLTKITIDDACIEFSLSNNGEGFYEDNDYTRCLSFIRILFNGVILRQTQLKYQTNGGYLLLDEIDNKGGKYSFSYNTLHKFPHPLTTSVNHWNGWNGGSDTEVDVEKYCRGLNKNREVDLFNTGFALLHKVTYPSGGATIFDYECNTYNIYYEKASDALQLRQKKAGTGLLCGGARICRISNYESAWADPDFRTYSYIKDGFSSGSICVKPNYMTLEHLKYFTDLLGENINGKTYMYQANYDVYPLNISANTYLNSHYLLEPYIGYSHVKEEFGDGSYNLYDFTSFEDCPDIMDITYKMHPRNITETSFTLYQTLEKHNLYIENSMAFYRGRLISKGSYSKSGQLVQLEKNTYNTSQYTKNYVISIFTSGVGQAAYKTYLTPCPLPRQETIDSNGVSIVKDILYNNKNLVDKETYIGSDGKSMSIRYGYPFNTHSNSTLEQITLDSLVKRNQLDIPIEVVYSSNNMVVGAIYNKYSFFNNNALIEKEKFSRLGINNPISNYSGISDARYKTKEQYLKYDQYGRLLHLQKNMNQNYSFIWGYKSRYIIASIENATYEDVKNALGKMPEVYSSQVLPDMTAINNLRKVLQTARVTSYAYWPMVGISIEFRPNNLAFLYEYDNYARLIRKSQAGKIEEEYEYHYRPNHVVVH